MASTTRDVISSTISSLSTVGPDVCTILDANGTSTTPCISLAKLSIAVGGDVVDTNALISPLDSSPGISAVGVGSVAACAGSVAAGAGSVAADAGSVAVGVGSVAAGAGSVAVRRDSVAVSAGSVAADMGSVAADAGSVALDAGSVVISGVMTAEDGCADAGETLGVTGVFGTAGVVRVAAAITGCWADMVDMVAGGCVCVCVCVDMI